MSKRLPQLYLEDILGSIANIENLKIDVRLHNYKGQLAEDWIISPATFLSSGKSS